MYMPQFFFYSSVDIHLGDFHILAIVNSSAIYCVVTMVTKTLLYPWNLLSDPWALSPYMQTCVGTSLCTQWGEEMGMLISHIVQSAH